MANNYTSGEIITGDNSDGKKYFEDLRWAINKVINSRQTGVDKSSFIKYDSAKRALVANTISTENPDTIITSSPFIAGLQVIQDLLKQGYMKPTGTSAQQTAANNIKNADTYTQYSVIPALTDFFTVVNYWNTGIEGSSTGCNGACTGYCDGSCAGNSFSGSNTVNDGEDYGDKGDYCQNCFSTCVSGCGDYGCTAQCQQNCYTTCIGDCNSSCDTCRDKCEFGCTNQCKNACKTTCTSGCSGNCQNGPGLGV